MRGACMPPDSVLAYLKVCRLMPQYAVKQLQCLAQLCWVLQLRLLLRLLLQQHKPQQRLSPQRIRVSAIAGVELLLQKAAGAFKAVAVEQEGSEVQSCCTSGTAFLHLRKDAVGFRLAS